MRLRLFLVLLALLLPVEGYAGVVKLGDAINNKNRKLFSGGAKSKPRAAREISCFENSDCPFDKECVALRCESVCKNSTCDEGTHCVPAGRDRPQEFKCVECASDIHCPRGSFCDKMDYTCKKHDPCINAVCSPAAPFCMPKPYKTLPYTCVQCLENEHCPPVAGLTRSCVDGYCLFNVEGNMPPKPKAKPEPVPPQPEPAPESLNPSAEDPLEEEDLAEDED